MAQKLNMYDVVKLKIDRPADGLAAGVLGTVLMSYDDKAYEVEFVDDDGATLAIVTLPPDAVEFVQSGAA